MESVVEAEVGTTLRLPVAVYGLYGWWLLSVILVINLSVIKLSVLFSFVVSSSYYIVNLKIKQAAY